MKKRTDEKASFLIKSADAYSITMYIPMLKRFPEMASIAESGIVELWDYCVFIACVGVAFMEIVDSVNRNEQEELCYSIKRELNKWKPNSYDVMVNLLEYVRKLVNSDIGIGDAIGGWIFINLEKHEQANRELIEFSSSLKGVRPLGTLILTSFHNWWL